MEFFGFVIMILALGVLAWLSALHGWRNPDSPWGRIVLRYVPLPQPQWTIDERQQRQKATEKRFREATAPRDTEEDLRSLSVGSFFSTVEEGDMVCSARLEFLELQFFGTDKSEKVHISPDGDQLREFLGLFFGDKLLLEQPVAQGSKLAFFLYKERTQDSPGFADYLSGTEQNPGPGRQFSQGNQRTKVELSLLDKTWLARDIVWADVEIEGKSFVKNESNGSMPRVVMLLAENVQDSNEFLLSVDLRSGGGWDTLWVGRLFDPSVECVA